MTDQLWVSAEVKRECCAGFTYCFASHHQRYVWLTVGNSKNNEIHNSYNDIHTLIFCKFIPTYQLAFSSYPTRETLPTSNWSGLNHCMEACPLAQIRYFTS